MTTTSRLIRGIKRRITMPANQVLIDDPGILEICDDVLRNKIVPEIISLRQDFFVVTTETPCVVDQSEYDIPVRAMGRTLRDLKLRASGSGQSNTIDLSLVAIEDEHEFISQGTVPHSFYFKGDKIVLVPTPKSTSDTIVYWWDLPPAQLIQESDAAVVASVSGDDITVTSLPATITTSTDVDLISYRPGYCTYAMDLSITGISGSTISFAANTLANYTITPGDYVSVIETSPLLQLPKEVAPFVETMACRRILQAIGDFEGLSRLGEDESEELKQMRRILEPRIRGESTKIINRQGLLRGARSGYRRSIIY